MKCIDISVLGQRADFSLIPTVRPLCMKAVQTKKSNKVLKGFHMEEVKRKKKNLYLLSLEKTAITDKKKYI